MFLLIGIIITSTVLAQYTLNDCVAAGCPTSTAAAVQCIINGDISLSSCQSQVCDGQAVSDFTLFCTPMIPACADLYSNTYAAEFNSVVSVCATGTSTTPSPTAEASPLSACRDAGCPAEVTAALECAIQGEIYTEACRSSACAEGVWSRFRDDCVDRLEPCTTAYSDTYRSELADVEMVCVFSAQPVTTSTTTTAPRDVIPPQLVSVSPPPGGVVGQRATLIMEFDEDVQKGPNNLVLVRSASNDHVILEEGSWLRLSGRYVHISPPQYSKLGDGKDCFYVQVEFGALLDMARNAFSGLPRIDYWTLCVVDREGPRVENVREEIIDDDSIRVVFEFDEVVEAVMATLTATLTTKGNGVQESIPAQLGSDQRSVSVVLGGLLLGERYRIDLTDGFVQDAFGNVFSGASFNGYSLQLPDPTTTPVFPTVVVDPMDGPNTVAIVLCVMGGLLLGGAAAFWFWQSRRKKVYVSPSAEAPTKVSRHWEPSAVRAGEGAGFAREAHLKAEDSKAAGGGPPPWGADATNEEDLIKIKQEAVDTSLMEQQEAKEVVAELLKQLEALPEDNAERRKAHKKMCFTWHPDKNPENLPVATEVFQWLQRQKRWLLEMDDTQPSPRPAEAERPSNASEQSGQDPPV
ncbi:hypothetical protein FOZ61_001837 [Perkinsus olseni]|uniref:Uncharacterized protein n=1 Tax=Perkinsus olseni TaxID=32597 RepID=A0A7J6LWP8_PEROL|nr:hypothetical protein FOZ61_001837 [Perkinsus olseni]KAF4668799.1 hypothetical protein FOL46_001816 [Perkinsus olseni]